MCYTYLPTTTLYLSVKLDIVMYIHIYTVTGCWLPAGFITNMIPTTLGLGSRESRGKGVCSIYTPPLVSFTFPLSLSFPSRFGPAFFKGDNMSDSRPFSSPYPRSHHPSPLSLSEDSLMEVNNTHHEVEEDVPTKRPRLLRDMQLDSRSSAESSLSQAVPLATSAVRDIRSLPSPHRLSSPPRVSSHSLVCVCIQSYSVSVGTLAVD